MMEREIKALSDRIDRIEAAIADGRTEHRADVAALRSDLLAQLARLADQAEARESSRASYRSRCLDVAALAVERCFQPGVVIPLVILALACLAVATGAGLRYGDFVIDAAHGAIVVDTDAP